MIEDTGPAPEGPEAPGYERPAVALGVGDFVSDVARADGDRAFWPTGVVALSVALSSLDTAPAGDPPVPGALAPGPAAEAVFDGMALLRVRDGARVSTRGATGLVDLSGREVVDDGVFPFRYSLVPEEALEEGWYVFAVDLREVEALLGNAAIRHPTVSSSGTVVFARVYWGARPMWVRGSVDCSSSPGTCGVSATLSQASEALEGTLTVAYDGRAVDCASPRATPYGLTLDCPAAPDGTVVEIDMVSDVAVSPLGARLTSGDDVAVVVTLSGQSAAGLVAPELGLSLLPTGE
ncbi:MAG: hypothetical protein VYE22_23440 [Myxococcota bacterium]|nr:hypothetical protein [Myxococcota bacterium]